MSWAASQLTLTDPRATGCRVGMRVLSTSCGPRAPGEIGRTAKRTRPCWPTPLTRGNSPPMTTYSDVPVTCQPACADPLTVPTDMVGNQWTYDGLGVPAQFLYPCTSRMFVPVASRVTAMECWCFQSLYWGKPRLTLPQ